MSVRETLSRIVCRPIFVSKTGLTIVRAPDKKTTQGRKSRASH